MLISSIQNQCIPAVSLNMQLFSLYFLLSLSLFDEELWAVFNAQSLIYACTKKKKSFLHLSILEIIQIYNILVL